MSNKFHYQKLLTLIILICLELLLTSCLERYSSDPTPIETDIPSGYQYQLGLGYGFLGKEVRVTIDGVELLSLIGTEKIEDFAQMLGTYMLVSGYSPLKEITVNVTIDKGQPYQQLIDLGTGRYLHIYLEEWGLHIYNTPNLILE